MTKQEQLIINNDCVMQFDEARREMFINHEWMIESNWSRFRTCTASTYDTSNYILLRSYRTIVAVYDKRNGVAYDVLRYAYVYTSTSCKHIHKFCRDMKATKLLVYKDVE